MVFRYLNMELAAKARAANDAGNPESQADASWEHLPSDQRSDSKANVYVYMDDFISVVHGGPRERRQMLCNLFHQNDRVF